MTPRHATAQPADTHAPAGAGRVGIIGDNTRDLEAAAERLPAIGFSSMLVDAPAAICDPDPGVAADVDVMLVRAPLKPAEIVQLLESLRDTPRSAPVWTIVLSRHQSSADRQRLIHAGARHLLTMPVEDATLSRVVRAALVDLATSKAIQDYVASHTSAVGRMLSAVFEIRTLDEAQKLSTMLATNCPVPEKVAVGIWELLSNAIEHGNLEIDYEEKAKLLETGRFEGELARRLRQAPYADRVARVEFRRATKSIRLRVTDAGPGFDFRRFVEADMPMDRPNGRGICIARTLCFDRVTYRGPGNVVEVVMAIDRDDGPKHPAH
ncbi:MAG TPA: ATP-binding protein [Xanthobacteraceae bacterium]|nr:ATP-binding protein [Xanthobacteraceae bacterium]